MKTVRLIITLDHIGLERHHIVRIRCNGRRIKRSIKKIKCVTETCVAYTQPCSFGYKMRNYSYPSKERFVLELPSSHTILATARPSCSHVRYVQFEAWKLQFFCRHFFIFLALHFLCSLLKMSYSFYNATIVTLATVM